MKDEPPQRKNELSRRGFVAGLASLLVPGASAFAAPESATDDATWFEEKLGNVERGDLKRMGELVLKDAVPLPSKVQFLKETLRKEGLYFQDLHDPELSEETLGAILQLNEKVSTDMTRAYERKDKILDDPLLQPYFDESEIQKVKAATRSSTEYILEPDGKNAYPRRYNEFRFVNNDDVYVATARHPLTGSLDQSAVWEYPDDASDQAIQYIAPSKYEKLGIKDVNDLPKHSGLIGPGLVSGDVVFSFGKDAWGKEHSHFSIATPLPDKARILLYDADIDEKYPQLRHAMIFVRPIEAAQSVTTTDKVRAYIGKDAPALMGAESLSGCGVYVRTTDGYEPVAPYMGGSKIKGECSKYCHAVSAFVRPDAFSALVAKARSARFRRSGDLPTKIER